MNELPPDDASDEIDELYRDTAAREPSRPSESVRLAIFDHAARLAAAARTVERRPTDIKTARSKPRRTWRPALVGTLAAALLAGLVVVPRFWTPPSRNSVSETEAPAPAAPAESLEYSPPEAPAAKSAASTARETVQPRPSQALPPQLAARDAMAARNATPPRASPMPEAALDQSSDSFSEVTVTGQRTAGASKVAPPPVTEASRARQRVDSSSALRSAARSGDILALNQALSGSVDTNARDDAGRTALMLAILNGHGDVVDALLAHGADPNVADAMGITPLAAAVDHAEPSIVSALRRAGAREK